jgi:PAS domain S-box-containing protein
MKKYLILINAFIVIILFCIAKPATAEIAKPEVLILNAYHQGEDWSDNQLKGILPVLKKKYPFLIPSIEHLDTKRFSGSKHIAFMKQYLKTKYQEKHFDLIMALDNSALDLILKFRNELFTDIPIVFAGVNGYRPEMIEGHGKITGVAEVQDMSGTIELILKLHPETKTIFAVHDYTSSGFAVRRDMEFAVERFKNRLTIKYTSEGTVADLVEQLEALPQDAIVMLLTFVADKSGRTLTREESTRLISNSSLVPVYAMHETRLGYGIVGGMLLEGHEHGQQAAALVLRILAGEDISRIPVEKSRSRLVMDYQQLNRFNIHESQWPLESIIINSPPSFWNEYKAVLIPAMIVVSVLLLATILLSLTILKMRQVQITLREATKFNEDIINNVQEGIIVYDRNMKYKVWNPFMENFSGYKSSDVIGHHPNDVFPFLHEVGVIERLEKVLAGESTENIDFPFEIPEVNRKGWASHASTALRNDEGKIIGVIATVRDITERKQAEDKLSNLKEFYLHILENVEEGIWVTNSDDVMIYFNPGMEKIAGIKSDDALGLKVTTDFAEETIQHFIQSYYNAKETLKAQQYEARVTTPEGRVTMQTGYLIPRRKNEKYDGMICTIQDITERKQAENNLLKNQYYLSKAQEIGVIGTWELDIKENILNWTEENYRIFGIPLGTEMNFELFLNCVHPDDRNYVNKKWSAGLNKEPFDIEHRLIVEDEIKWVREKADINFDSEDNPIMAIGFTQDITNFKKTEEQIKASLIEKETLLHEVHHRVKNNMQVINSLLKLQSNTIENDQIKEILNASQSRVYAMSAVHETLHGSEILSEIDLKDYLSKVTTSIFQTYSVNPGKVKLNSDIEETPISLNQAYPLGLITNELISNSLKYAFPENKKGEITVSLKKLDKEFELIIMDDGVGMPDDFDWKNSSTLGFKLVRTLVENQLDGSIDKESKKGTKFIIKFNIET